MWKSLQIANNIEDYFFRIKISETDEIQFFLTDLKSLWKSEKQIKDEIVKKAKELNKRIEFDSDKVIDTIRTVPSVVELQETTSHVLNILKIKKKYYISGRPFTFDWILSPCDRNEFEQLITIPLLVTLSSFQKQNEQLLKIIENKDIEINQYKAEGCVLVRSSVATQPIDVCNLKKSNLFMLCDKSIKKFEEICKDDLEEPAKVNCNEILSEVQHPVKALPKSPAKSKKKRMIKKREELAEKRLRVSDNKIPYYESPSFIEDDVECNNEIVGNTSTAARKNNSDDGNDTNRNESISEIEEIKNSLAELNRRSEILLQEEPM